MYWTSLLMSSKSKAERNRYTTAKQFHILFLKGGGYVRNMKNYHSSKESSIAKHAECTYWIHNFMSIYYKIFNFGTSKCVLKSKSIIRSQKCGLSDSNTHTLNQNLFPNKILRWFSRMLKFKKYPPK